MDTDKDGAAVMNEPLYPDVEVQLVGESGNAMSIMGRVARALKAESHKGAVEAYYEEATSGDYDNVLITTQKYVNIY